MKTPPSLCFLMYTPFLLSLRVIFHGPESEVPNSLSSYGILRDTIPAHMGGTLEYDPSLWIANRRAVELEMEEL
jgi:hypothetical protein